MFSALGQGSLVHIIDKTDGLKYKVGEVIGHTSNNTFGNMGSSSFPQFNTTLSFKIKVDGNVVEYPEVPANGTVASYNNGNVIISETKDAIISQIESVIQNSKQSISEASLAAHRKNITDGEEILKQLSPMFAKDKERDDRIDSLDSKFNSMQNTLDKILNAISNKQN